MGYPLLARYGLAVFPGKGSLIFEEDLSGETITVPASEDLPGLELTQVERDNPIQSVVPLYSVSAPTVTEDGPSDFNRDEGSVRSVGVGTGRLNALVEPHTRPLVPYEGVHSCTDGSAFLDGCHVPASAGYLCAPQTHDASCAGERAQGSLGTSVPWSERFNSSSPTIDTLTYSEVTAPHATVDTTHTILNTQSVPQEMMERPSQVLLSLAGTSCGSGPDAQVIPSTIIPITPELQGSLLTPSSAGLQPEQGLREDPSAVHKLTGAAFKGSRPESESTGWDYHKLVSVVLALSGSIAAQAGIHQNSRGWIEKDTPPASAPTRGDPQLVDALCIMASLLAGLCHQAKVPHSVQPEKHSAWPEVPTTGEPIGSHPRVPAAGTDWDQTKEAMVNETLSSLFLTPTVLPSPDIRPELSDQGPAAQLQVSGDLTRMIAVFAEDWLDIGDRELSGARSIDVHDQDFESCSRDEASWGFHPPDEFMGRFRYSRDHGIVELGAMNISVIDLQDPQDKAPMAIPAPTGVSQEIPPIRPRQSAGIPRKLRRPGIFKNERYDLRPLWREKVCEWAGRALGTTEPLQPTLSPFDCLGTVRGVREKGRQWREWGQGRGGRRVKKRNRTALSPPRKTKKAPKGYMCPPGGEHHTLFLFPPAGELLETVQKVIWGGGKGVIVVPVRKREKWFWSLGEIAVDWWDIPKGESIFWEG